MSTSNRKPRIALMGEFSAGKSTLSNLLLGARPLPEKVTATRLSPVWMSKGTGEPYRVDVDGSEETISIHDLGNIPVEETRVIRMFFDADILDVCDLIDFPGISDPNMSAEVWERMLEEVDAVLWCTHATQAWRQSEAAVWETIPQAVRAKSALLITKFDKLTTERDKMRVMARLDQETDGLFAERFPISLTNALAAGDDYEAFEASGGIDFLQYFLQMIEDLHGIVSESAETLFASNHTDEAPAVAQVPQEAPQERRAPVSLGDDIEEEAPFALAEPEADLPPMPVVEPVEAAAPTGAARVLPRRVRPQGDGTRRPRPRGGKTIDMDAAFAAPSPIQGGTTSELRAIFQEKPDPVE